MATEKRPYIGVTGFTEQPQVISALNSIPKKSNRLLMVGVLATWKSLRDIPLKPEWQKQVPGKDTFSNLFLKRKNALNLVHYSTESGQESSILADMLIVHRKAGNNFHGFQLNIAWPDITQMDDYRMAVGNDYRIVLQIGKKAVDQAGGSPTEVVKRLFAFTRFIDDILFDLSSGRGKLFNTDEAYEYLSAIADRGWNIGLGIAGGLGPDTLDSIQLLLNKFPNLNIDAQGRLRDEENNLNLEAVKTYLTKAYKMFS